MYILNFNPDGLRVV